MNPNIASLRRQEAEKRSALAALNTAAGDQPLTAEQQAEWDKLTGEKEAIAKRIEQLEKFEADQAASAQPLEPRIEVGHDRAEDAPWAPAGSPRVAFGNFLHAVHQADPRVRGVVDPRLHRHAASGTNEGIGSEGGFLVETDETVELNRVMFQSAQLASRCQQVEIGPNSNSISTRMINETSRAAGSRWGGVQAYWASEGGTVDATKPDFRLVDQKLAKLMGLWYCTEEELADVNYISSVAANAFGEEMAFVLDEAIYRGDGAGKPLGMLASPALVTISKEAGQLAATIVYENLVKMYSAIPASSILRMGWFVNPDTLPQILTMSMGIGIAGVPVYLPPNGAADAPFGTILGRPIIPNEHSNTLGTVGDIVAADLGWMRLIKKGSVVAASSIHVKFIYDEQTFRFTFRVNAQPMIASKITPAQGTSYVSPFVALETRS